MGVSVPVLQAHPIPLDGYTAGSPDTSSFAQRTDASEASSLSGHYPAEQGTADAGLRSRAPAGRGHDAHGGLRGSGGAGAHSMGADDGGASVPSDAAMFQYAPVSISSLCCLPYVSCAALPLCMGMADNIAGACCRGGDGRASAAPYP